MRHYTLHIFASTTLTTVSTLYSGIYQSKNSNHSDRSSKWLEVACVSTQWLTKGLPRRCSKWYIYWPNFQVIIIRHLTTFTLAYSCTLFQVLIISMYTTNYVVWVIWPGYMTNTRKWIIRYYDEKRFLLLRGLCGNWLHPIGMWFVRMCEKRDFLPIMQHTGGQSQNHKCGQRWNSIKGVPDGAPNESYQIAIIIYTCNYIHLNARNPNILHWTIRWVILIYYMCTCNVCDVVLGQTE